MRRKARWAALAAGLALTALGGTAAYLAHSSTPTVDEACRIADTQGPWQRQDCVAQYYTDQLDQGRPLDDVVRETQYRYLAGDTWIGRGCHTPLHAIGDWVKQNDNRGPRANLDGIFLSCDVGYAHGLTGEYDITNPKYDRDDLGQYIQTCRDKTRAGTHTAWACIHGSGHIVAVLSYRDELTPHQWLDAGMQACSDSAGPDVGACLYGHFMVWNLFAAHDLQENPENWAERWFTNWPDLCDTLDPQYQGGCLRGIADAHALHLGAARPADTTRPYCPETEYCPVLSLTETVQRCETYPAELRNDCYYGLGYDRLLQLQPNTDLIEQTCGAATANADQLTCFIGALQSFEDPLTDERCRQLSLEFQWVCPHVTDTQDEMIVELIEQRRLSGASNPADTPETFLTDCQRLLPDSDLCQRAFNRVEQAKAWATQT